MIFVNKGIGQVEGHPAALALDLAQAIKCVRGCFPNTESGEKTADKLIVFSGRLAMLSDKETEVFAEKYFPKAKSIDDMIDLLESYQKEKP